MLADGVNYKVERQVWTFEAVCFFDCLKVAESVVAVFFNLEARIVVVC